jgi:hypothetical protein
MLFKFQPPNLLKGAGVMTRYKVVELSTVTEETIQHALNEWSSKGWHYEGIQFAMRDASRRPAMAFIVFTSNDLDCGCPQ